LTYIGENWNLRQILKISNGDKLIKELDSNTDYHFIASTCGILDKDVIDSSKRNSKICNHKINVQIDNFEPLVKSMCKLDDFPLKKSTFTLGEQFDFIKYEQGGKFDMHYDSKQSTYHNHTLLLFPPQNIVGGELVVRHGFNDDRSINILNLIIKPHKYLWTLVLFPIGVFHASNPVLNGEKITLKGTAYIDNIQRIKIINKKSDLELSYTRGLVDGSFHTYSSFHISSNVFYDSQSAHKEKIDFSAVVNASFDKCDDEL
jgi:hypothetical protein